MIYAHRGIGRAPHDSHSSSGRHCTSKIPVCCVMIIAIFMANFLMITLYLNQKKSKPLVPHVLKHKEFERQLVGREMKLMLDTIDKFTETLTKANISFFMYGGTLVGSWRHHGQIPWDDDVDFAIPLAEKNNASQVLSMLQPDYILNKEQKVRWKLYSTQGANIKGVKWHFPFLDISFYHFNGTHIWDEDEVHFKDFIFLSEIIFPLTSRPFEGRWLPSPRKAGKMLNYNYDLDKCMTGSWSHRAEYRVKTHSLKCSELHSDYAFVVRRSVMSGGCNESLVLNGKVIRGIVMKHELC